MFTHRCRRPILVQAFLTDKCCTFYSDNYFITHQETIINSSIVVKNIKIFKHFTQDFQVKLGSEAHIYHQIQIISEITQLMNQLRTIPNSNREKLEDTISKKIIDSSTNRNTIDSVSPLMSTNKSIMYIKLPKRNHQLSNNFRSSLYQASIRRLKQLQTYHAKDTVTPRIKSKQKTFQQFQQAILQRYRAEKDLTKSLLPKLNQPFNKMSLNKHNYTIFLQEKFIEEAQQFEGKSEQPILAFTYKNLKEKYLKSKQISLNNNKKNQQKNNNRNSLNDGNQQDIYSRYKMNKQIEQHMNRYNQRDLFQHRLQGIKTNIHPQEKERSPLRIQQQKSQPIFQKQFSNFVKRKKLKSIAWAHINRTDPRQKRSKVQDFKITNPQQTKQADFTPWDTDNDD